MKIILILLAVLAISSANAATESISQTALETLMSTQNVRIEGDILEGETLESIYSSALNSKAKIENECKVNEATKSANCILWLTHSMGETAIEYNVSLDGKTLLSTLVFISRGVN